jgi:ABC-type sugar transport system ATPase subunit
VGSSPEDDGGVILSRFPASSVPAEIYATEPLGDSTILDLKVGDKLLKAVVGATFEGEVGAKIGVQFPGDRIHLFHRKSGKAIR